MNWFTTRWRRFQCFVTEHQLEPILLDRHDRFELAMYCTRCQRFAVPPIILPKKVLGVPPETLQ